MNSQEDRAPEPKQEPPPSDEGDHPAAQPAHDPASEDNAAKKRALREAAVRVLKTVYDPEIPVNIYELGLVYSVDVSADGFIHVRMTLTAPSCPVAESLPVEVEAKLRAMAEARDVLVEVVWDPPWNMSMMSEAARLTLGF